jgi:hypothetical protein
MAMATRVVADRIFADFGSLLVALVDTSEQLDAISMFLLEHLPYVTPTLGVRNPSEDLINGLVAKLDLVKDVIKPLMAVLRAVPFESASPRDTHMEPVLFTSSGFMFALLMHGGGLTTRLAEPFPGPLEEKRLHETWEDDWKDTALVDDYRFTNILDWLDRRRALLQLSLEEKVIFVARASARWWYLTEGDYREMVRGIDLAQQDILVLCDAARLFRTTIPMIAPPPSTLEPTKKRARLEDIVEAGLERAKKLPRRPGKVVPMAAPAPAHEPED